jgi:hypothetical protein
LYHCFGANCHAPPAVRKLCLLGSFFFPSDLSWGSIFINHDDNEKHSILLSIFFAKHGKETTNRNKKAGGGQITLAQKPTDNLEQEKPLSNSSSFKHQAPEHLTDHSSVSI